MNKYRVEVTRIVTDLLAGGVEVEAKNRTEAIEKARALWDAEKITLDYHSQDDAEEPVFDVTSGPEDPAPPTTPKGRIAALLDEAVAYDRKMSADERPPNGDDYNEVIATVLSVVAILSERPAETTPSTTFDFAQEAFKDFPSRATAGTYLATAMEYEIDDMIGDDTFHNTLADVRDWLLKASTAGENASEHTKGTWRFGDHVWLEAPGYHDHGGQRYRPIVSAMYGSTLALVLDDEDDPEGPANAALICAAPELQAGCDAAESFMSGFEDDDTQEEPIDDSLDAIRVALANSRRAK